MEIQKLQHLSYTVLGGHRVKKVLQQLAVSFKVSEAYTNT